MQIHPKLIGFDIDGVVADTSEAFLRIAREEFGHTAIRHEDITAFEVTECLDMKEDLVDAIFERLLHDPIGSGLRPMPNAVKVLEELSRATTVSFITARPEREPVAQWLLHTLGAELYNRSRLMAMGDHDGKTEYIKDWGLEFFVDDRAETCHLLAQNGITPIVFDQPWNRGQHNFTTVDSWSAIGKLCSLTQ